MKIVKKILSCVVLAALLVSAGCGSASNAPTVTSKPENTPTETVKQGVAAVTEGAAQTPETTNAPETTETPDVTKPVEGEKVPEATKTPENNVTPVVTEAPKDTPKATPTAGATTAIAEATSTPAPDATAAPTPVVEEKKEYTIPYGITWQDSASALKNYAVAHNLEFVSADEDNGTLTVKLTETEKAQFVNTYRKELKEGFEKYPDNPECEGLVKFTVSDDLSELKVYSENGTMADGCFTAILTGLLSVLADAEFNQTPCKSIISLYNNATEECIYQIDFQNATGSAEEVREKVLSELLTIALAQEINKQDQKTSEEEIFATPESDAVKVRLEAVTDTLLLDNENVLIKLSPLKTAADNEMTADLFIENRTGETLTYYLTYSAINGLCVEDSGIMLKLNPGESKWETVSWEVDPFDYEDVTKLQFGISAYNGSYDSVLYQKFVCLLTDESKTYNFVHSVGLGEKVVLDNKYVYVVASEFETGEYYSYVMYYAYNKTGVDMTLSANWSVVDNFMCPVSVNVDIPAGIGVIDYFFWNTEDFTNRGISYPATMEISLEGTITSNYDSLFEEVFELSPQGEGVLPFDAFELPEGSILLEDNDKVRIYITGMTSDDSYYGLLMGLYIENKTEENLMFMIDGAIINQDKSVNAGLYSRVNAGKKAVTAAYVLKDEFDEKNINEVETLAMGLYAIKADTLSSEKVFEGTYSIIVK